MSKFTEQQLYNNYKVLVAIVEKEFPPERADNIKRLFADFEEEMILAPASGVEFFHNCFPGGYVAHVLDVINASVMLLELWMKAGFVPNFTTEELIFSALFHDFGKLGDGTKPYYIAEKSEWHRKNMSRFYKINESLPHMDVTDRAIFILQQYGIKLTQNEWYGIKLADGLYNDMNKKYIKSYNKTGVGTSMHTLLHHADHFSTILEDQTYFQNKDFDYIKHIKIDTDTIAKESAVSEIDFDDLFKD